ncbi:MAG: FAD-binding oxidoreductase [Actinomycetota bacterium]
MAVSTDGTRTRVSELALRSLEKALDGELIRPGDHGYDQARAVWNGMIDRRPALIARCRGVGDVVAAVNFVRDTGMGFSVRGGGHNVAGTAVCDGGLVVDLSQMTAVDVDPLSNTVRAEAGALLGDLDRATQAHGLAVPAGTVSETGIAGLTLGGGMGWLSRRYGLTCDNVIGVDMVMADGTIVRVTDESDAHLMWGLRGGGGNFGIVTSFTYRAAKVGPSVLAGLVLHPIDSAKEFLEFYADFAARAPDELTTIAVIRVMPPVPSVPRELHGVPVAGTGVCYVGDIEEGERLLQPLRDFGSPLSDTIALTPFVEHQAVFDEGVPSGHRYYEKSEYLPPLTSDLIDTLVDHGNQVRSPYAFVGLFQLGGAVSRVGEQDSAYTRRDAAFSLVISAGWQHPGEDADNVEWVRTFWGAVKPHAVGGVYVNFMSHDETHDRVVEAYGRDKYRRLVSLKDKFDPENLFRLNQNIVPSDWKDGIPA